MIPHDLTPIEIRVLGSLIEKELSTPDHYPLSLNALTNACNQSSNRDPLMRLDETTVADAVTALRRRSLVRSFQASGTRVPKYEHLVEEAMELTAIDRAVLCVLMLRGPQTLAEIRTRAGRLTVPADPLSVDDAVERLAMRPDAPHVTQLARRPGQKEARYAQLLSGEVVDTPEMVAPAPIPAEDRLAAIEDTLRELRNDVTDLRAQLDQFRRQFE